MFKLRLATYNIHKCQGLDRRTSVKRIADVIAEVNPDVIGLQEVLSIENGTPELNQARYLADALSMHIALGEVRTLRGGIYGNVVLSKHPVTGMCTFDLSVPGREQRGCLRTDVSLRNGTLLHVFNFHLGTAYLERRHQARRILESELIRSQDLNGPRVVLGDFNEWTRGLVSHVLTTEFQNADIRLYLKFGRSYPWFFPFLHLDHIYYDNDLVIEHVGLHKTRKALVASDHLPLYADFAVREP
jgi:endonuclease/exonuclease/phosphatase family metal-dependent hydrolase